MQEPSQLFNLTNKLFEGLRLSFFIENWFEVIGVASGLLCVLLLIRENILTFPIGLVYAVVTTVVVIRANLYADALLNLYYVVMNAYGWYYWRLGGAERRKHEQLTVGRIPSTLLWRLCWLLLICSLFLGWGFDQYTDADLAYADSFTTVASFVAMWMTARKYLESWHFWFVIDVVQIALYIIKGYSTDAGLFLYAGLYAVYLGMAVTGYLAWKRHLNLAPA